MVLKWRLGWKAITSFGLVEAILLTSKQVGKTSLWLNLALELRSLQVSWRVSLRLEACHELR